MNKFNNFTFDGFGVNGADEYRSRLATLTEAGHAAKVGPMFAAAPELMAELKRTGELALELMERAARIDRMLAEAKGATLDCELGEIARLRGQLSRNNTLIDALSIPQP